MSEQIDASRAASAARIEKKQTASKAAKASKTTIHVAEGKAISSPRGILGPGSIVTPSDFSDGQAQIDKFIKSGHLSK